MTFYSNHTSFPVINRSGFNLPYLQDTGVCHFLSNIFFRYQRDIRRKITNITESKDPFDPGDPVK